MRNVFIRYEAKPERVAENRALIEDVFAELAVAQPEGLRYLVLDFEDGSFVHFAMVPDDPDANPLKKIKAFQRFSADSAERQVAKPWAKPPRIVGDYRMLSKDD
jgi:hypothetical protein